MPRIRTIKPEFWTDDKIVELSPWARLLYIGLWNFADDNGVLEHKPKQIKMRIFPADEIEIDPLILELEKLSLIQCYEVDNQKYIICPNLAKHQVIDKPRKSNLPLPENYEINRNQLKSTEIMLGREGKRKGKGKEKEEEKKILLSTDTPVDRTNGFKLANLAMLWNTKRPPELATVNLPFKRNPTNLKKLAAMLSLYPEQSFWEGLIEKIHHSSFLRGKNNRGWKATFDFVVSKADEINDGKYIDLGGANQTEQTLTTAYQWAKRREAQRNEPTG